MGSSVISCQRLVKGEHMSSNGIPLERLVNLDQLDVIFFLKLMTYFHI